MGASKSEKAEHVSCAYSHWTFATLTARSVRSNLELYFAGLWRWCALSLVACAV